MKEQPSVKMSVEMGRQFMLMDLPWFDTDMRESSNKLCAPFKDSPVFEKMKFTLCQHAVNAYRKHQEAGECASTILEIMWYTYGFAPSQFLLGGRMYVALVAPRGICWIDQPPRSAVEPNGVWYPVLFDQAIRLRTNLVSLYRREQQLR